MKILREDMTHHTLMTHHNDIIDWHKKHDKYLRFIQAQIIEFILDNFKLINFLNLARKSFEQPNRPFPNVVIPEQDRSTCRNVTTVL